MIAEIGRAATEEQFGRPDIGNRRIASCTIVAECSCTGDPSAREIGNYRIPRRTMIAECGCAAERGGSGTSGRIGNCGVASRTPIKKYRLSNDIYARHALKRLVLDRRFACRARVMEGQYPPEKAIHDEQRIACDSAIRKGGGYHKIGRIRRIIDNSSAIDRQDRICAGKDLAGIK